MPCPKCNPSTGGEIRRGSPRDLSRARNNELGCFASLFRFDLQQPAHFEAGHFEQMMQKLPTLIRGNLKRVLNAGTDLLKLFLGEHVESPSEPA